MLQSIGLQRVGHDWVTELNWTDSVQHQQSFWTWKEMNIMFRSLLRSIFVIFLWLLQAVSKPGFLPSVHLHWRMMAFLFLGFPLISGSTSSLGEVFCQIKDLQLYFCQDVSKTWGMTWSLKWLIYSLLCEDTSLIFSCYWLRVQRKAIISKLCKQFIQFNKEKKKTNEKMGRRAK